jgi:uncharacterized membrane protein
MSPTRPANPPQPEDGAPLPAADPPRHTEPGDAARSDRAPFPTIRSVEFAAPFKWLWQGARSFYACPAPCLFYGLCFAAMGWVLGALLRESPGLMMALIGGFLLVGPFMAMGLYEVARRHECGERCSIARTTVAWRRNLMNIAILGIGLGILLALWARSSMMVIAIFFPRQMPSIQLLLSQLALGSNLEFVATYLVVGAVFALLVFAFSAIAIPLMLDRGTDAITAMLASVVAVGRNLPAMLSWAVIVVALTVFGFVTFFVGLIVTVPLVGLATWHSYRDLVMPADAGATSADGGATAMP